MNKTLRVSFRLAGILLILTLPFCAQVWAQRSNVVPGRRAIVFDERISVLRVQPDLKAPLRQRLRRGRVVGILGTTRQNNGARFLRVAISRNVQGWILADAVARPGRLADAERLMGLIEETREDFAKLKLARLCADSYRSTRFAARALLILGETAESAANRLTRDAKRRLGEEDSMKRRLFFLNDTGLDRYNRIGVTFDYEEAGDRIIYDGKAYRELLRRYPRSEESKAARKKLDSPQKTQNDKKHKEREKAFVSFVILRFLW
jgi:hypothetical protein